LLQCLHAKRHVLESWRQLVEIILTACPQDLIQAEDRQLIIRDILQDVHDKVMYFLNYFMLMKKYMCTM
jgi:nuclear pore complex protein Nup205